MKESFYDWCIHNEHQDWLDLWDYELNQVSPHEVSKGSGKKFYFKCSRHIHCSESKNLAILTRPIRELSCTKCKSFGQWCVDNNLTELLQRWDCRQNKISPFLTPYKSGKKYFFKCPADKHPSELKPLRNLVQQNGTRRCRQCNSFGQYCVDTFGNDFFQIYWSEKNSVNPFLLQKFTHVKVMIKCTETDYHEDYDVRCSDFVNGERCPYCRKTARIHPADSIGTLFPQIFKKWTDENKSTPYNYSRYSNKKAWFRCENNLHKNYKRLIQSEIRADFECPKCSKLRTSSRLQTNVSDYIASLGYSLLHEYECSITPVNHKTKRPLPFDNEIPELKMIIEVHGAQHYKASSTFLSGSEEERIDQLNQTQRRDKYKKSVAIDAGYFYVEIPYWTERTEEYKNIIDDAIRQVTHK